MTRSEPSSPAVSAPGRGARDGRADTDPHPPGVSADPGPRLHLPVETDAEAVATRARATGVRIGAIIPARNEQTRIGGVVGALHDALQRQVPLLDDLLVVDADSTDTTRAQAEAAGARVVTQRDVLADHGTGPGKGEAMWKGLAASDTDLVVFVDGDLVDPDPGMVVALVAPLVDDPSLALVRAAYDRPLRTGEQELPAGGGRVTELTARPLLATYWPALAVLAQPLGGEYAIRRTVVEQLPLVRGYGVELALTIDVARRHGAVSIGEVDVGVRRHDHQSLDALGRMATEVLLAGLERAGATGGIGGSPGDAPSDGQGQTVVQLPQPRRDGRGMLRRQVHHIRVDQRPPLRP